MKYSIALFNEYCHFTDNYCFSKSLSCAMVFLYCFQNIIYQLVKMQNPRYSGKNNVAIHMMATFMPNFKLQLLTSRQFHYQEYFRKKSQDCQFLYLQVIKLKYCIQYWYIRFLQCRTRQRTVIKGYFKSLFLCEALIADDLKVIANAFRKTISAAKTKFLHRKAAITFEKKISKLIAGLPY